MYKTLADQQVLTVGVFFFFFYGTLTALMMLVWPDPGIQPVTTITMSPDLKNPLALPDKVHEGDKKQRRRVSETSRRVVWRRPPLSADTLTYVHAKVDSVVHVVGPDGSRQRVEEDGKHSS